MYQPIFQTKSSSALTRAQLRKGISILSELQTKRHELAAQHKQDRRYYMLKSRAFENRNERAQVIATALLNRGSRNHRYRIQRPTAAALAESIRNLLLFSESEIPHYLPCGADDAYGERQAIARHKANRFLLALKALNYLNRRTGR